MTRDAEPTGKIDPRAVLGARNNADWYEAMFALHGLAYRRTSEAFIADDMPPPYYSKLTVLSPDENVAIRRELADVAQRFGGALGLKDSFCQLDLVDNGFETLFDASWIWRPPSKATMPEGWNVIRDAEDLDLWEEAWKRNGSPAERRMFPDALLDREDVFFLGRRSNGRFQAGCIANRSKDCIGISNVFSADRTEGVYAQAADAVAFHAKSLPVVGYESGSELNSAEQAGFTIVGPLRVLVTGNARF